MVKITKADMCITIVCALYGKVPKELKRDTEPHRHYKRLMKEKKANLVNHFSLAVETIEKRNNFNIKDWVD